MCMSFCILIFMIFLWQTQRCMHSFHLEKNYYTVAWVFTVASEEQQKTCLMESTEFSLHWTDATQREIYPARQHVKLAFSFLICTHNHVKLSSQIRLIHCLAKIFQQTFRENNVGLKQCSEHFKLHCLILCKRSVDCLLKQCCVLKPCRQISIQEYISNISS